MRCVNPNCNEPVEEGAPFCPFCAAPQTDPQASPEPESGRAPWQARVPASARAGFSGGLGNGGTFAWHPGEDGAPHGSPPSPSAPSARPSKAEGALALRASESVWHFEEPEGKVKPGERRALLIVDEQVTHLAHTDRRLTPSDLLARTRSILQAQEVPVEVREVPVAWVRDPGEARPRLVASLAGRRSDIQMIFGVDYLGEWASIQMQIGIEPDPLPQRSPPPEAPAWKPPIDGIVALVLGVLTIIIVIGIVGILYGGWRLYTSYQEHQERTAAEREGFLHRQRAEELRRQQERAAERLARTFKVDDARLFCAAMGEVFRQVVDDLVERGGEVVRIQGGRGGYFDAAGLSHPEPAVRTSDAAELGV